MWTSPWRIYTNEKQTEILNRTDDGAVLFCGEWDRVPIEDAKRLGLVDDEGRTHSPLSIKRRHNAEAKEGD